ncbi:MAG: hypothetical protein JOZ80_00620 [Acidobacteriaceae bacterium]|nr:hypothetical protein [Acidobacteriaceae bacterium]
MHRALAHFRLGPMNLVTSISLFFFFSSIWLVLLGRVCRFWGMLLGWSISRLPLQATLDLGERYFGPLHLPVPYIRLESLLPSPSIWLVTCIVTVLLFAVTSLLPHNLTPLRYLVRAMLAIQGSALLYFALWPLHFKQTPDGYMEALVHSGIGLISVVPLLFALTYYIFDFGLWKKAFLTALTMTHLTILLPFQILLQALVLQNSLLFMPVLYIVFGLAMDVMVIIAFYSWGMTWAFRDEPHPPYVAKNAP